MRRLALFALLLAGCAHDHATTRAVGVIAFAIDVAIVELAGSRAPLCDDSDPPHTCPDQTSPSGR